MNEDEKFFNQFQDEPRPEFATALYERINRPMNTHTRSLFARRVVLAFALTLALMVSALSFYPPARAQALSLLRQIGALHFTTEAPATAEPTAVPPSAEQLPISAASPAKASQLAGFAVLAPSSLPDGYSQEGSWSIQPNGNGETVNSTYFNPSQGHYLMINQYRYQAGDAFTDTLSPQEKIQTVQVRGQEGAWITGRLMVSPIAGGQDIQPAPSNWLYWEENGVVFTLISDGLDLQDMLQLADSLK